MSKLQDTKDLIRELAELLDSSTLSEIEVEDDTIRIRVARQSEVHYQQVGPVSQPATPAPNTPAAAQSPAPAETPAIEPAVARDEDHPGVVPSPMVGTVYLSPEPGAPSFIKEGDAISEGDTLLIVEAMKVMNPIPAPKSGTVKKVIVSDAQPVEYGEPLAIIE